MTINLPSPYEMYSSFAARLNSYIENLEKNISGEFTSADGPMANMSLVILDGNGEILQIVVTDENGNFEVKNIPSRVDYQILVDVEKDKIPEKVSGNKIIRLPIPSRYRRAIRYAALLLLIILLPFMWKIIQTSFFIYRNDHPGCPSAFGC